MNMSPRMKSIGFFAVVLVIVAGSFALAVRYFEARDRVAFSLVDQHGETVTQKDLGGRYLLVFFGFTNCHGICPTYMSDLTRVMADLDGTGHSRRVTPVFISVDPERDDPAAVNAYMARFDARFVGNFLSTADHFIQFLSGGRFNEFNQFPGDYAYARTGPNTGTVTQTYDDTNQYGGSCTVRLTFVSATAGTLSYTCAGGRSGSADWRRDLMDSSAFNIEVVWESSRSSSVDSAFQAAVARWERVIAANISGVYITGSRFADFAVIDDLRIYARVEAIDGPGGVGGSAGPKVWRRSSQLPAISTIRLDAADVPRMSTAALRDIVLHEIAHALGFGTHWKRLGLLSNSAVGADPNSPPPDTHFTGAKAITAFDAAGGKSYTGAKVPVENVGGLGIDGHWRRSVFGDELMKSLSDIRAATQRPLSLITVQSMADVGYSVNVNAADSYTLPSSGTDTMPGLVEARKLADSIPLKCVVMRPVPTDGVKLIELK